MLGLGLACFAYAWLVILYVVAPLDLIVTTNDVLVKWAVKTRTTMLDCSDGHTARAYVEVDYRFGSRIVLGAWLGTLHLVGFLKGL